MKPPKNSDDEFSENLDWLSASSTGFQVNLDLGIIATNRLTLKWCYSKLESRLSKKLIWVPLFGITLACFTPLVTVSSFNVFWKFKEGFWQAIYAFFTISTFAYGVAYLFKYLFNRPSEEAFIKSIEAEAPCVFGEDLKKFLSIHGLTIETSDKESFDEGKAYTLNFEEAMGIHDQAHTKMSENELDKDDEPTDSNAP